jgi:hypothetical protein
LAYLQGLVSSLLKALRAFGVNSAEMAVRRCDAETDYLALG